MTEKIDQGKQTGKVPNRGKSNVPRLRFPEFEGEWEARRLGEIADKVNSGKTPLGGEAVYTKEGVLFIRSQNINNDKLELENSVFIPQLVNNKMKNSIVKPNDILLNITGASLGRSCVVPKDFKMGNVNQHVCIIRLKQKYKSRFVQPIFSSYKGQAIFNSLQTGSGREGLNFESIRGIKLSIPQEDEQQKIESFLLLIDERITTQNKILLHYKSLIQNLRNDIFKQKIRIKGFTNVWKEKTLGEIATFYSGGTPLTSKKEFFDGDIPFIRSGEINSNQTEQFISELGLKNSSAKMVEIGDILYALYGATSGEVGISKIKGAINQAVLCIKSLENHYFIYSYLLNKKESIISTYLQGGQGNLSAEIVKQITIPLPSIEEQNRITSFLIKIDQKIQIENTILEQLEMQKKYLLQHMFV